MSALINSLKYVQIINRNPAAIYTIARNHGWNKDFKPGKYPLTDEERRAAAKKYGLIVEDYKPYPDDGFGYGDYPHLPDRPTEYRDPYYPWDHPELKRNFGEPIHAQADFYDETRYGAPQERMRYSFGQQLAAFSAAIIVPFLLYFWLEDKKMFRPALPKQMPEPGVVHYTFETKS